MTGGYPVILDQIIEAKREDVAVYRSCLPLRELKGRAASIPPVRDFVGAVRRDGVGARKQKREEGGLLVKLGVKLIAEIKKASPSRGLICHGFNPRQIALLYQEAGASAISVLTDVRFFLGHPGYLRSVKGVTCLPLLRKDFIIDEYQIYQSRHLGADAVLLIASILDQNQLVDYLGLVKELGMAALVEVHTPDELFRVLETEALLVGINNRNLHTFQVDLGVTHELISAVSKERVVVSESGIRTPEDVARLGKAGVDAVLVGEALIGARDIKAAVVKLMSLCP